MQGLRASTELAFFQWVPEMASSTVIGGELGTNGAPSSAKHVRKYRRDVQGLRGIAVILVVAYHSAFPESGGFVGVDVFFVLSGFVITRMLVAELESSDRISLGSFYARRVRRLLPALGVVLGAVAVGVAIMITPLGSLQDVVATGFSASLFAANAALFEVTGGYFDVTAVSNPLLHLWTLAVEEQFYVVFPALLLAGWLLAKRLRANPRQVLVALVCVTGAASAFLCVYLTYSAGPPFAFVDVNRRFAFYGSPSRAWEFAAGALVALLELAVAKRISRTTAWVTNVIGVLGLLASVALLRDTTAFPGYVAGLPVTATACLLVRCSVADRGRVARALESPALTWVGDQSYSWYLWHWPLIVFVRLAEPTAPAWSLVIASMVGLLAAWGTGRIIENPIRRDRRFAGRRAVTLAVVCCGVPAMAFGGLSVYASHPPTRIRQLAYQGRAHLDLTNQCTANLPGAAQTEGCTWRVPGARGTVLLLGDSNAGQFAEPVLSLARKRGLNLTLATYGGCPFANVSAVYVADYHDTHACDAFVRSWSNEVARSRPTVVIVASASSKYINNKAVIFVDSSGKERASTTTAKADMWSSGLRSMLQTWAASNVPVVVVNAVPQFQQFDLRMCPALVVLRDARDCAVSAPTERLKELADQSRAAEDAAVQGEPGMTTVDLFESICRRPVCSTYRDGEFAYRDGAHLSVAFAERLEPQLAAGVDRVLPASRQAAP